MLGIGIFWKSQKFIPSKKNQSVLIAKNSSRKTQKIANPQKNSGKFVPHDISFNKNSDFDAISVMDWSCAARISKVERALSYRFCARPALVQYSVNRYSERSRSEYRTSHYLSPRGIRGFAGEGGGGHLTFN